MNQTQFENLDNYSIQQVALRNTYNEVIALCQTNKRLNDILCKDYRFWQLKAEYDFGTPKRKFDLMEGDDGGLNYRIVSLDHGGYFRGCEKYLGYQLTVFRAIVTGDEEYANYLEALYDLPMYDKFRKYMAYGYLNRKDIFDLERPKSYVRKLIRYSYLAGLAMSADSETLEYYRQEIRASGDNISPDASYDRGFAISNRKDMISVGSLNYARIDMPKIMGYLMGGHLEEIKRMHVSRPFIEKFLGSLVEEHASYSAKFDVIVQLIEDDFFNIEPVVCLRSIILSINDALFDKFIEKYPEILNENLDVFLGKKSKYITPHMNEILNQG